MDEPRKTQLDHLEQEIGRRRAEHLANSRPIVQDGRIVWCVFPSPVPDSGKKPPAVPGVKP